MLNKVILMGRCGSDPEMRVTPSGVPVTTVNLAVDRDFADKTSGKRETDWITVVAWRETGKFLADHFTKGRMAVVSGRLQIRKWTDKDGNNRNTAEVVADNVYFGDSKKEAPTEEYTGFVKSDGFAGGEPEYKQHDFALLDGDDSALPF